MTNPTQRRFRFAAVLAAGGQASLSSEVFVSVLSPKSIPFVQSCFFKINFSFRGFRVKLPAYQTQSGRRTCSPKTMLPVLPTG